MSDEESRTHRGYPETSLYTLSKLADLIPLIPVAQLFFTYKTLFFAPGQVVASQ